MKIRYPLPLGPLFRDIPGWPGYMVGHDGSIWSAYLKATPSEPCRLSIGWFEMKQYTNRHRRKVVSLFNMDGSGRKVFQVHRLVLLAFAGACPEGQIACHYDGDSLNNAITNLRWDTPLANSDDARRHGTIARGERQGSAKLTVDDVMRIRELHRKKVNSWEVAEMFGISRGHFFDVALGRRWSHLK